MSGEHYWCGNGCGMCFTAPKPDGTMIHPSTKHRIDLMDFVQVNRFHELSRRDERYLKMCIDESVRFSTCIRRQYYAILLDRFGHIIGTGYNGVPSGMTHCNQGGCPRGQSDVPHGSDYAGNCWAAHAEANALLHSDYTERRDGCTLYVNGPPCWGCAVLIANGSVSRLVCLENADYADWPDICDFLRKARVDVTGVALGEM